MFTSQKIGRTVFVSLYFDKIFYYANALDGMYVNAHKKWPSHKFLVCTSLLFNKNNPQVDARATRLQWLKIEQKHRMTSSTWLWGCRTKWVIGHRTWSIIGHSTIHYIGCRNHEPYRCSEIDGERISRTRVSNMMFDTVLAKSGWYHHFKALYQIDELQGFLNIPYFSFLVWKAQGIEMWHIWSFQSPAATSGHGWLWWKGPDMVRYMAVAPYTWYRFTVKPRILDAPNPKTEMILIMLISSWSCRCQIHWSHVFSREWRCSWSSADWRCSNYICVINSFNAY